MTAFTRRRFLALAGASAAAARFPFSVRAAQALTVQDVMTRVQQALGGTPAPNTIDGLKAGRTDLGVTGIATTALATVDVIRRASAAGCNLIVTFEPTFFARTDQPSPPNRANDPTFTAKRDLIGKSNVAVWRLHDQWLAQRPASFTTAFAEALEWQRYQTSAATTPERIVLPGTTLRDLVAHVQKQLGAKGMRVIGRPDLPVTRVILSPGPSAPAITFGNLATADVILAGEPREWEGVEYVQDAIAAGQAKGMILVGRVLSQNPGMRAMAAWLTELLPGMRIQSLAVPDPYWRPAAS